MKLTPVIELEPGQFTNKDYPIPPHGDLGAWDRYWKQSLRDSGLVNLEPFEKASWFVPILQINSEQLTIVLDKFLEELELVEAFSDWVGALYGGFVLDTDSGERIYPECCGDLANVENWQMAAQYVGTQDRELWIGHPWLLVHGDPEWIYLTQTSESGEPSEPCLCISRTDLNVALEQARHSLDQFCSHVEVCLQQMERYRSVCRDLARHLVFGPQSRQRNAFAVL